MIKRNIYYTNLQTLYNFSQLKKHGKVSTYILDLIIVNRIAEQGDRERGTFVKREGHEETSNSE